MVTSATDGYSPCAALEPPTMAIEGAAVRASAAAVAATSVSNLREKVMRSATQPARRTCASEARDRPAPERGGVVDAQRVVAEREQAAGHDQRPQHEAVLVAAAGERDLAVVDLERARLRRVLVGGDRDHRQPQRLPPQERVVVVLGLGVGELAELDLAEKPRRGGVGDIEQRQLGPRLAALRRGVLP